MTILTDMRAALAKAIAPAGWRIGSSAYHALNAEIARMDVKPGEEVARGARLSPTTILSLPYERTADIEGWELVCGEEGVVRWPTKPKSGMEVGALRIDLCEGDGMPCYVGMGTDDARHRCGTTSCGKVRP